MCGLPAPPPAVCAVVHNDSNVVIYANCDLTNFSKWTVKYTLDNVRYAHFHTALMWPLVVSMAAAAAAAVRLLTARGGCSIAA